MPFGDKLTSGGWQFSGPYDATLDGQVMQISDAQTSGSFGDWVFSPKVPNASGTGSLHHFVAAFDISTAPGARNTDTPEYNHISVSPDDGTGNRMSYLRFENRSDGVHVFFDDVTSPATTNGSVTFNDNDIATLTPGVKHAVKLVMDLTSGDHEDSVRIYIDGKLVTTGSSWKYYYQHDQE